MLAPNAPVRAALTALAERAATAPTAPAPNPAAPATGPAHRRAARYAWALLLARISEVFPLRCALCGAEMRVIAFITAASSVRNILAHLGEPTAPPRIAPARGPPLWEQAGAEDNPSPDAALPPTPAYEFDQRIHW